jgi:hypothetical protein
VIERELPYRQTLLLPGLVRKKAASIVIGMSALVGMGQQRRRAVGFDPSHNFGESVGQGQEKILVNEEPSVSIFGEELYLRNTDAGEGGAGFTAPDVGVALARAIVFPESPGARSTVGTQQYPRLPHALQQKAAPDDFIIRVSHDHQGPL